MVNEVNNCFANNGGIENLPAQASKVVCAAKVALEKSALALYYTGLLAVKATVITAGACAAVLAVSLIGLTILFWNPLKEGSASFSQYVKGNAIELFAIGKEVANWGYASPYRLKTPKREEPTPLNPEKGIPKQTPSYIRILHEESKEAKKGTPIIFVPGYMGSPEGQVPACEALAKETNRPIYIIKNSNPLGSIESLAHEIESLAKHLTGKSYRSEKAVYLLGHSMGGLATGYFANYIAPKEGIKVKLWCTIGSPLEGAPIAALAAKLGLGASTEQMRPGAPFLKELHEKSNFSENPLVQLHIHTQTDLVSSCPKLAWRGAVVCPKSYGHTTVRESLFTLKTIAAAINSP